MKNVAVLTEDGAFALFFRPHPGGFDSSRVPTPGNLPSKAKKNANARGSGRGGERWAQLELTDLQWASHRPLAKIVCHRSLLFGQWIDNVHGVGIRIDREGNWSRQAARNCDRYWGRTV